MAEVPSHPQPQAPASDPQVAEPSAEPRADWFHRLMAGLRANSPFDLARGLPLRPRMHCSGNVYVKAGWPRPAVINHGEIVCGGIVLFPGVRLECLPGGHISIGRGTFLNRNALVVAAQQVIIGRDCKISWDVVIMDTHQHAIGDDPVVIRPVLIEDDVRVGARAIILPGVTLGHGAIVGAGSVVTRDVAPRTIVVGNPARAIRSY